MDWLAIKVSKKYVFLGEKTIIYKFKLKLKHSLPRPSIYKHLLDEKKKISP